VEFELLLGGQLRLSLGPAPVTRYESWFAKLVEDRKCYRALFLRAPNGFVARYIETHFAKKLALAVDAEMPTPDGLPRRITLTV
jgi:chromosomal replication initiation ATPase DnaA